MAVAIKVKVTKHAPAVHNTVDNTHQFGKPIQSSVDALYIEYNTSYALLLTCVQGMISSLQSERSHDGNNGYGMPLFHLADRRRGDPAAQIYVFWDPDWIKVTDTNWNALRTHLTRSRDKGSVHVCFMDVPELASSKSADSEKPTGLLPDSREDLDLPPSYESDEIYK
ncbi:hypothetical protein K431DRAFT_281940 [Polychaeton citri CBS 116435]|uniref:Uncharacterized protein n=1 Tax=Polychaeton citri CBS 116435 TaxID=1314669 RepID=A0A9P4UQG5_9PEZI|nr:hypothetical protein K431DRAFT_281940 [Polychaeton citri CBS 116435]